MKSKRKLAIKLKRFSTNLFLIAAASLIGLFACDGIFRLYETYVLNYQKSITKKSVDLSALNYNDTIISRKKDQNEFRILSFGDSIGYCTTKFPYSYHGIAQKRLNTIGLAKKVRIVNLSEPCTSFYQYIKSYRYWSSILEYDAVVFNVYLGNDILDVAYKYVPDDAKLNRIYGDLEFSTLTGITRNRVPKKYMLRSLDYSYAYYLMWKDGKPTPTDQSKGKYLFIASDLPEDKYYEHAYTQMDNFNIKKLASQKRGYLAFIDFTREVSRIRKSGKKVLIMLTPSEAQVTPALQEALTKRYNVNFNDFDLALSAYIIHKAINHIDPEIPVMNLLKSFMCGSAAGKDLYLGTNTHMAVDGDELAGENLAICIAENWLNISLKTNADCTGKTFTGQVEPSEKRILAFQQFLMPLLH